MRFPDCSDCDFRRVRIKALLEQPFDKFGKLRSRFHHRVYKPILLAKADAFGRRWMQLDNRLCVQHYAQPEFPESMAPLALV